MSSSSVHIQQRHTEQKETGKKKLKRKDAVCNIYVQIRIYKRSDQSGMTSAMVITTGRQ